MYIDWHAAKICAIVLPIIALVSLIIGGICAGLFWLIDKLFKLLPAIPPAAVGWFWVAAIVFGMLCAFDVIRFGKRPE